MASLSLRDSMDTKALPSATDLKRALVDILYRRQFGALLIFGIDPLNRTPGDNMGQVLNVIDSIVTPAPDSFRIADDQIALLFDADDARVHEIPSSLPAVIAEQTGHRVSCGGVKISSEDYGLHPRMSELIFSTAQCVLARGTTTRDPACGLVDRKIRRRYIISNRYFSELFSRNCAYQRRAGTENDIGIAHRFFDGSLQSARF